jgi:hypothetical protein
VFASKKKGRVGRKKTHVRAELCELAVNVPLNKRGTYWSLASHLNVSKDTVMRSVAEGVFRIHSSALKPFLTEENKDERYQFAMSQIDLGSMTGNEDEVWQYEAMFDEVHVDKKWFNETFETRRYLLVADREGQTGEENPSRKVKHKRHILVPKIMFLSAQARPRHDPHRNCVWDGKLAMILIGNWVKAQRNSKYYKKGDLCWKNHNVDTQAYFENMEDVVRTIAKDWP